ncbi:LysM peptidoglycan-binding domain-containing protein [Tepidibacillus marianensis]|uniref:LysM peptidoglycan-binding domain-containing protein n=1 Tax=Tepidibacillus marianensis TaxID=3131995 RepID=UPI0030D0485A
MQQEERISHPLPPRSSVHHKKTNKMKKTSKIKKWNSLQMIVILFIFLILATAYGLYQYGQTKGTANHGTPIQTPVLNNTSSDSGLLDSSSAPQKVEQDPKNDPVQELGESVESGDSTKEQAAKSAESQIIDSLANKTDESKSNLAKTENVKIHIVQPNETLFSISDHYYRSGTYAASLAKYNHLKDLNDLKAGFRLKIPPKESLITH